MMREYTENAYGKLNLSLDVTGRREDGYHLLRMVMQTVDICDSVTIRRTGGSEIVVASDSGNIPSGPANLVWRAADVMRKEYGLRDGFSIHIKKRIPVAAGMAGGSADAAAVFRLLRQIYDLDAVDSDLERLALPLGADIPYCISGGTKLCEGIGEVMSVLPAPPDCAVVIVKPSMDVSTGWAYREFDAIPANEVRHPDVEAQVQAIRKGDLDGLCSTLGNVLEQKTGEIYPVIGELERYCIRCGAGGSIMTGSGPAVFAVFENTEKADRTLDELREEPVYQGFQMFRTQFINMGTT